MTEQINKNLLIAGLFFLLTNLAFGQGIKGKVTNRSGNPVPYATIYMREIQEGTSTNINGEFEIKLKKGDYTLLIRSLGYEPQIRRVMVEDTFLILNPKLIPQEYKIKEVKVHAGGADPATRIMRKTIGLASYHLNQVNHYRAEVYIKGSIRMKKFPRFFEKKIIINGESDFKVGVTYVEETLNEIIFDAPDRYQQTVVSFRTSFPGNTNANPMDYIKSSLYQPMIDVVVSPLAPAAFHYYKFSYEGSFNDGPYVVAKIKVLPKRKSQQLLSGYLFIVEDLWNIYSANLKLNTFIGPVQIKQILTPVKEDAWLPVSYNIAIDGSFIGIKMSAGYAGSIKYSDIQLNPTSFQAKTQILSLKKEEQKPINKKKTQKQTSMDQKMEKILNKEELSNRDMIRLSGLMGKKYSKKQPGKKQSLEIKEKTKVIIEKNASKKDTLYWSKMRPIPLSDDEVLGYKHLDSLHLAKKREKSNNDTIPEKSKKNRVLGKITGGTSFYLLDSTFTFRYDGLINPENFGFNTVDGFTFFQSFSLNHDFEKGRYLQLNSSIGYAFSRQLFLWNVGSLFQYAPLKRGAISMKLGTQSADFNGTNGISRSLNALSSLFFRENYLKLFESNFLNLENNIDLFNGLQFMTRIAYDNRFSLTNNSDFSFFFKDTKNYTSNMPENPYLNQYPIGAQRSFSLSAGLKYTPQYYYRIRGGVKRMSQSRYPTFSLLYAKGLPGIFESVSDYDYLEFGIEQTLKAGLLSELNWNVKAGGFVNNNVLYFSEFKHFNTQDIPVLFNKFQNTFQLLPYYKYSTPEKFVEAHLSFKTPYLALKFLPFLSNKLWNENLYLNYLNTSLYGYYMEAGYSLSDIFFLLDAGVFSGFENGKYRRTGLKLGFRFD